jgi:malonate transporter
MDAIPKLFLETLLPVFFVLGLGFYAGRLKRVDNRNTAALSTVLMHFALPCSLFLGVARTPPAVLRAQSPLLAVLAIAMAVTYGVTFALERRVFRANASESAVQSLTVAFSNNVAIGLPLLSSLYGATGLLAVAAGIVTGALVISPVTLVILECNSSQTANSGISFASRLRVAALAALRRPVVLAPLAGVLFPIFGWKLPEAVVPSLDLIGKATIGLALFLTGLILSAQRVRLSAGVATGILLKNFAQPALIVALLLIFRLHGEVAAEALLLGAVPAGFFGTVFGTRYGVTSLEASSTLLISTALSAVTLPLALAVIARLAWMH